MYYLCAIKILTFNESNIFTHIYTLYGYCRNPCCKSNARASHLSEFHMGIWRERDRFSPTEPQAKQLAFFSVVPNQIYARIHFPSDSCLKATTIVEYPPSKRAGCFTQIFRQAPMNSQPNANSGTGLGARRHS